MAAGQSNAEQSAPQQPNMSTPQLPSILDLQTFMMQAAQFLISRHNNTSPSGLLLPQNLTARPNHAPQQCDQIHQVKAAQHDQFPKPLQPLQPLQSFQPLQPLQSLQPLQPAQ